MKNKMFTNSFFVFTELGPKPSHFLIEPLKRMAKPDGMSSWCHDMLFSGIF
jgi:hypothetical protein